MSMKKIIMICLCVFFGGKLSAAPWYSFADNQEVDEIVDALALACNDRNTLANKIFERSIEIDSEIKSLRDQHEKAILETNRLSSDTIELRLKKNIKNYLALIIKASDLGHRQAKSELYKIIKMGTYGIDNDDDYADKIMEEIKENLPYVELNHICEIKSHVQEKIDGLSRECSGVLLYAHAENFVNKDRKSHHREQIVRHYVAMLLKASRFGSIEAKRRLVEILHEGSFGVKRDLELASLLKMDVFAQEFIDDLPPNTARVIQGYLNRLGRYYRNHHIYDGANEVLELVYNGEYEVFYGTDAVDINAIIEHKLKKIDIEQNYLKYFAQSFLSSTGIDLDKVD